MYFIFFLRKSKNKQADILEGPACFTKSMNIFYFVFINMHIYFIKVLFIREVQYVAFFNAAVFINTSQKSAGVDSNVNILLFHFLFYHEVFFFPFLKYDD